MADGREFDRDERQARRDEARYWRNEAKKARQRAVLAHARASGIVRPEVTVERGETYWRVYVNGQRIEGWEEQSVAENVAACLVRAFAMPKAPKDPT